MAYRSKSISTYLPHTSFVNIYPSIYPSIFQHVPLDHRLPPLNTQWISSKNALEIRISCTCSQTFIT